MNMNNQLQLQCIAEFALRDLVPSLNKAAQSRHPWNADWIRHNITRIERYQVKRLLLTFELQVLQAIWPLLEESYKQDVKRRIVLCVDKSQDFINYLEEKND